MTGDPLLFRTDVLVIGAGLAGLRAAWAAGEADPGLSVTMATPAETPSGSSFANRNNALGMQVPDPGDTVFDAEVLALAAPGFADPALAALLRREAAARLAELEGLGLAFRRGPDGSLVRVPGCFSAVPRAVVFTDLAGACARFRARATGLGVDFRTGLTARRLLVSDGRACGAVFLDSSGQEVVCLARAVVLAAGGPCPLFARDLSGPGNAGLSYGLLAEAGVRTANLGFVQFQWFKRGSGRYVSPAEVLRPGTRLLPPGGGEVPVEPGHPAPALAASRNGHCPAGYGLPDAALDELLLAHGDAQGGVRLRLADDQETALDLWAQAGNGGAVVDTDGATSLPGLFACGECATGMHGANRLGGAMVLATQVFGRRAGTGAARFASGIAKAPGAPPRGDPPLAPPEAPERLERIRRGMQRSCLFGPGLGLAGFVDELRGLARESLFVRSALALSEALLDGTLSGRRA